MKYQTRTSYSDSQKALMWERWKQGETLHQIVKQLVAGRSIRTVAALLGRAASTVSREIKCNGGQKCYRASQAAWDRGHHPKICKLARHRALARETPHAVVARANCRARRSRRSQAFHDLCERGKLVLVMGALFA